MKFNEKEFRVDGYEQTLLPRFRAALADKLDTKETAKDLEVIAEKTEMIYRPINQSAVWIDGDGGEKQLRRSVMGSLLGFGSIAENRVGEYERKTTMPRQNRFLLYALYLLATGGTIAEYVKFVASEFRVSDK